MKVTSCEHIKEGRTLSECCWCSLTALKKEVEELKNDWIKELALRKELRDKYKDLQAKLSRLTEDKIREIANAVIVHYKVIRVKEKSDRYTIGHYIAKEVMKEINE